ncbi:MAG: NUDIX domain-containing protein [Bacteroidia bacterium]|nr:NUDIX domain-containing protein [Bacteroidia bacterium]
MQFELTSGQVFSVLPRPWEEAAALLREGRTTPDQLLAVEVQEAGTLGRELFELQQQPHIREQQAELSLFFPSPALRDQVFAEFRSHFREVAAAGGIVVNERDAYLMIHNQEKWSLPKGHPDPGEPLHEAALREVREETGVRTLELGPLFTQTLHTYLRKGRWHLKTTHWYLMRGSAAEQPSPQTEEQIDAAVWMSRAAWLDESRDSYPLTRQLMEQVFWQALQ